MSSRQALRVRNLEAATEIGRFLARRGVMLFKEFKKFGRIKCDYGGVVVVSTLILTTGHIGNNAKTFGIKLEQRDCESPEDSCLLDYDEIKELLQAIKCLVETAEEMRESTKEYTECIYCTKDKMSVGFYQNEKDNEQRVFFSVNEYCDSLFLTFDQLRELFRIVKDARDYLKRCGADSVDCHDRDAAAE